AAKTLGVTRGDYVKVSVSDTGTGIDKDTLERVFDPFFTTKPLGEGTGLGLSMVYGFAKQSHGHVRIHSQVGSGTTVSIYLMQHRGDVAIDSPAPAMTPAHARSAATVLVVDDEPTVRMLVVDALSDLGYHVLEAIDGASGLALLDATPEVDLLITDVGLPGGLNGRQVADAARTHRPGLKVMFITGYAENAVLNHGHVEPGMAVVTKPFSVDDLVTRVERMVRAG
ncbi:response regulator, partial [uncultured Sphingomonas sp.]